jgi:hypothetical protein
MRNVHKIKNLIELGAIYLLSKYNRSPSLLLSNLYPEYEWLPWRFQKCPNNYWNNINNHKKFVEWASKELNIKEMSDWYKVSIQVTHDLK